MRWDPESPILFRIAGEDHEGVQFFALSVMCVLCKEQAIVPEEVKKLGDYRHVTWLFPIGVEALGSYRNFLMEELCRHAQELRNSDGQQSSAMEELLDESRKENALKQVATHAKLVADSICKRTNNVTEYAQALDGIQEGELEEGANDDAGIPGHFRISGVMSKSLQIRNASAKSSTPPGLGGIGYSHEWDKVRRLRVRAMKADCSFRSAGQIDDASS